LNRKNALFAGHDLGAGNWATIACVSAWNIDPVNWGIGVEN
jgi:hypothetical protein